MRIIHYVAIDPTNTREGVIFTNDDSPAGDFIPSDCKLYAESEIDEDDLPSGFPVESNLEKVS